MKLLKEYLSTKVNINNLYEDSAKTIMEYLFIFNLKKYSEAYNKVMSIVLDWCKEQHINNADKIYPMADKETINELTTFFSKEFTEEKKQIYDDSEDGNEKCQHEMENKMDKNKLVVMNDFKISSEYISIYATQNCLSCYSPVGAIYCWRDKDSYQKIK